MDSRSLQSATSSDPHQHPQQQHSQQHQQQHSLQRLQLHQQPLQHALPSHHSSSYASSVDHHRGAVQKRSSVGKHDRHQSISAPQAERLYRLAAEQTVNSQHHNLSGPSISDFRNVDSSVASSSLADVQWITPQSSPQLSGFAAPATSIDPYPQWTVPTPPRSDSGIPSVAVDSDEPVTTGIGGGNPEFAFSEPAVSAEMSSLGLLLPSQYGASPYDTEQSNYPMDQNYIPPMRMSQPPASSSSPAYAQTASSSPGLVQRRAPEPPSSTRRHPEMPASAAQSYEQSYRRTSSNPYHSSAAYSMPPSQTIPSISGLTQSPLPSPHMQQTSGAQMMPQYHTSMSSRSPDIYPQSMYAQHPPYATTAPGAPHLYAPSSNYAHPPPPPPFVGSGVHDGIHKPHMDAAGAGSSSAPSMRVLNQRPKPQCWDHGCNGRQFSTFSNLLRHQREKSGTAAKSFCPKCGAEFTRTTARNGHLAHDKCTKQRRTSDAGK